MTKQEIFDHVSAHLLKQKTVSIHPRTHKCLYFGPGRTQCAVGCMLSAKFRFLFEGRYREYNSAPIRAFAGALLLIAADPRVNDDIRDEASEVAELVKQNVGFFRALQHVHDKEYPERWDLDLRTLAMKHKLEFETR